MFSRWNTPFSALVTKRRVPLEFDRIADTYDLLVALAPGYKRGLHASARRLRLSDGATILDLCCGTGLSTLALLQTHPTARLTALDASPEMVARARRKPLLSRVRWIVGDAEDPARAGAEGPFDAVFMAYGIRNLHAPDRCLRNILDLLVPGGVAGFHEYSLAEGWRSRVLWSAIAGGVILPLGLVISGNASLFRYLRASVLAFDRVTAFESRLRRAGFAGVKSTPGRGWQRRIVHTFVARRPP